MPSLLVVPIDVLRNVLASNTDAVVGLQIDSLVLDGSPHAFDKHVVPPRAATVHREFDAMIQHSINKALRGELTALNCTGSDVASVDSLGCVRLLGWMQVAMPA